MAERALEGVRVIEFTDDSGPTAAACSPTSVPK